MPLTRFALRILKRLQLTWDSVSHLLKRGQITHIEWQTLRTLAKDHVTIQDLHRALLYRCKLWAIEELELLRGGNWTSSFYLLELMIKGDLTPEDISTSWQELEELLGEE